MSMLLLAVSLLFTVVPPFQSKGTKSDSYRGRGGTSQVALPEFFYCTSKTSIYNCSTVPIQYPLHCPCYALDGPGGQLRRPREFRRELVQLRLPQLLRRKLGPRGRGRVSPRLQKRRESEMRNAWVTRKNNAEQLFRREAQQPVTSSILTS